MGSIVVTSLYTVHCTVLTSPHHSTALYTVQGGPVRQLSSSQLERKNVDTSIPPHTSPTPAPVKQPPFKHFICIIDCVTALFYCYQEHRALFSDVISFWHRLPGYICFLYCYLIHQVQQPERILSLYKLFFSWITINNNECPVKTIGCHFQLKVRSFKRFVYGMEIIY